MKVPFNRIAKLPMKLFTVCCAVNCKVKIYKVEKLDESNLKMLKAKLKEPIIKAKSIELIKDEFGYERYQITIKV